MTMRGRKYYGTFLEPVQGGWHSNCFGKELSASTLAGIKRAVRDNYPGPLLYKLRRGR